MIEKEKERFEETSYFLNFYSKLKEKKAEAIFKERKKEEKD